jgi:hypothetical protein
MTDSGRNSALDGFAAAATYWRLLDRTLTEIAGGSYARLTASYNAAASGAVTTAVDKTFDVSGVEVCFLGFITASGGGTDKGYTPLGGHQLKPVSFDAATDTFTVPGHGYSNTNQVVLFDLYGGGLPTGFTEGTIYYVIASATNTFQLSATSGGSAITVAGSALSQMFVQRCSPENYGGAGTYKIPSGTTILTATLV